MAKKKFGVDQDLQGNKIINGGFEVFATLPTTYKGGQITYANKVYTWNGTKYTNNENYFAETGASDTAGRWTVNIPGITELYDGLQIKIVLKTSYDSTYNTLNINGLGQALVWWRVGSRLTSHFSVNSVLNLTYYSGAGTYSTFTGGWVIDYAYYSDTVTTNNVSQFRPLAGELINAYKIGMLGLDDKFYPFTKENSTGTTKTVQTVAFKLNSPIFWFYSGGQIALDSRMTSLCTMLYEGILLYTLNQTFPAYTDLYLVGIANVDNNTFVLDNSSLTSWCTNTLPTIDNGKAYMYLGKTYSSGSSMHLFEWHPVYYFKDGALRILNTSYISGDSHTHSGYSPSNHNHDYNLLANLPVIYNANHDGVSTDDFDTLYNYQNDIWLCSHSMCNAPLDNEGGNNASYNTAFDNCVVQQFGDKDAATKIQVLYITTGDVANLSMGSIFYRMQGDKWKRIATYSDIADLQAQIGNLTTTVNNKQDKLSILTDINIPSNGSVPINPSANKVQYINLSGQTTIHTINLNSLNSLDEYTMVIINPNNASRLVININSSYKFVGVQPSWSFNSWVICIWRGMIFANILN